MENMNVYEFKLKDGTTLDGTFEDLHAKGYTSSDIVTQQLLYNTEEITRDIHSF